MIRALHDNCMTPFPSKSFLRCYCILLVMFRLLQRKVLENPELVTSLLSSSFAFSCTMMVGDAVAQNMSPQGTPLYVVGFVVEA